MRNRNKPALHPPVHWPDDNDSEQLSRTIHPALRERMGEVPPTFTAQELEDIQRDFLENGFC